MVHACSTVDSKKSVFHTVNTSIIPISNVNVYYITISTGKFHRRCGDTGFVNGKYFAYINDRFTVNGGEMKIIPKVFFEGRG